VSGGQNEAGGRGRVLVVDDDAAMLRAYERVLAREGFTVATANDGQTALALIPEQSYDAIVSDIAMPGMTGIELLRAVREHDLDVPVVIVTAGPTVETAARAVELGAFRYLVKPIDLPVFVQVVTQAVGIHRLARIKREAQEKLDIGGQIGDLAGLEVRFISALKKLWMAYQPVVSFKERRILGYEALVRSAEPALPDPMALLDAAERLGWEHELGRIIRDQIAKAMTGLPDGAVMLVNLHPKDLLDETLFSTDALLTRYAKRVILEITERASLDEVKDVRVRVARLRESGFRIAVDDLGAGYAGLSTFAQLEPEVVKLDMSLVRDVHKEPIKQQVIRAFTALCRDMGMQVIAEGVETAEERRTLLECGCDLLQGFLFARPASPFPPVTW